MYTDTTFIDNVKAKCKAVRRLYGHIFEAVNILRESFSEFGYPFVMKSSKRKVGLMLKLDKDGNHRLSNETVFLDVLHSRCKTWRTYTLSYYDIVLKQLVKLATMEVERENGKYCEIFFQQINKMLIEYRRLRIKRLYLDFLMFWDKRI